MRYLRDLPVLKTQFSRMGPKGWEAMVQDATPPDPHHDAAWQLFLQPYDLPEFRSHLHSWAARDLAAADAAGVLERWELGLLDPDEIERIEEVKRNDAR